jgi:small multidrug resistance pump
MSFLFLLLSGSFSALASILLKVAGAATTNSNFLLLGMPGKPLLLRLAAVGAYGVGFVLYALALKRIELSIAYPLMVAVTILEIMLFGFVSGETLTLRTLSGAVLLLVSVLLLYWPSSAPATL